MDSKNNDIIDPSSRRITGDIVDGRVSLPRFSKLAERCEKLLGMRSRLVGTLKASQEAADNLKARGFDPTAIDRVMWMVNEPFPLSILSYAERAFTSMPLGIALVNGHMEHVHQGDKFKDMSNWLGMSFTEGRSRFTEWDMGTNPAGSGAGGKGLAAAIAIGAWKGGAQKSLMNSGLSAEEAKRFVAGHELGHVVFLAAGNDRLIGRLMASAGIGQRDAKGRALVTKTAEELFADALGALAACPGHPAKAAEAASRMRRKIPFGEIPSPIYIRSAALRAPVAERLEGGGWSGSDGAADLAAECLAMAIAQCSQSSPWQTQSAVGAAFAKALGRGLVPSKKSQRAPRA